MCGIVGAKLKDNDAVQKVFHGLETLEYRGYDSAGIVSVGNPSLKLEKATGTVDEVELPENSNTCIGHTRWATHGGVTEQNAHPHTDCSGRIAVVHNGIIENFQEIKEQLHGHEFSSETDTEVIPHLIEEELESGKPLKEAVENTREKLEGSYAVLVVTEDGEMAAFRKDSPLVIGEAEEGYLVSSDVTGFLEYTNRAIYLEDGDLALISDKLELYRNGEMTEPEVSEVDWNPEEASKKGYDHYMEKEIREQSKTVKRAAFQNVSDLKDAAEMIEEAETVYMTGCGTAFYAAEMGAQYLREKGVEVVTEQAHELEYRTSEIEQNDLVIAVSQSGETADLLSTLKDSAAETLAIVNVVGSTLARNAEKSIFINAGPEIGVASTKAFTAQMTVLKLIASATADKIEETRDSLVRTAEKIPGVIEMNEEKVDELSKKFAEADDVYFIGRGKGKILAYESALKLKELSYIHAEGFAGGEFKHGTLALVEEGVPVVSFTNYHGDEIMSNTIEAKSRGAEITQVGNEKSEDFDSFVEVPEDENSEILEVVPFQMLAYRTSVRMGHNPDKPRNLAKSVTVK